MGVLYNKHTWALCCELNKDNDDDMGDIICHTYQGHCHCFNKVLVACMYFPPSPFLLLVFSYKLLLFFLIYEVVFPASLGVHFLPFLLLLLSLLLLLNSVLYLFGLSPVPVPPAWAINSLCRAKHIFRSWVAQRTPDIFHNKTCHRVVLQKNLPCFSANANVRQDIVSVRVCVSVWAINNSAEDFDMTPDINPIKYANYQSISPTCVKILVWNNPGVGWSMWFMLMWFCRFSR